MRTLLKISLPLMVSYLSMFAMMFVDRAFLAQLSTDALNACVKAGMLGWTINLGFVTLASMAEVFVAQYNGAKAYSKLGVPVWQMLWMALFSLATFIPMAMWCGDLIYGASTLASTYFKWIVLFGPFYVMLSALSAFYIGQGKTMIITVLAVVGNAVNVVLDPIFIFGIPGKFPAMGVLGAALATGFGVLLQSGVLFFMFVHKRNREAKGSNAWRFSLSDFMRCFKVGISPAVFVFLEMFGWTVFYHMMGMISEQHLFVAGVCQSIYMLFIFFGLGLEKGAAAIAGNFIGAGKLSEINRLVRSGLKLIGLFGAATAVFMIFYPDALAGWFIKSNFALKGASMMHIKQAASDLMQAKMLIKTGLILIFFYMVMEKIRWLFSGILTSAGDTFFLLVAGSLSVWLILVLPTYLLVVRPRASITVAFVIWVVYSFMTASLFFARFLQGKWKALDILEEKVPTVE